MGLYTHNKNVCFHPVHRYEFGPRRFFSKKFKFGIIFYSTFPIFWGANVEKHADPEKKNRSRRKSRANSRNLLEPFLRSRKEKNLGEMGLVQFPNNSFKRLYTVTGWQRSIGCLKLQVTFRKRATNYRALLRKMTCKDKASYDSTPPCKGWLVLVEKASFSKVFRCEFHIGGVCHSRSMDTHTHTYTCARAHTHTATHTEGSAD